MPDPVDQVDRYAVVGNPVGHSLSPRIHRHFAEQTGQALSYEAIELARDAFAAGVGDLARRGYRGLNVTVPFKREAWEFCAERSERARRAGAVNTMRLLPGGACEGDNTDGVGLVRDLAENLGVVPERQRLLLLGAGGAVRGVLGPLLAARPERLVLCNRTPEKAESLAREFAADGDIEVRAYADLAGEAFDLVINGTAAGLDAKLPPLPAGVVEGATCYDMMYDRQAPTAFVAWSLTNGATVAHDGLGMLVEQAAEAFLVWRGQRPETARLLAELRSL